jgi:SPP1 gp7 family putative phage head morphogenesis protein
VIPAAPAQPARDTVKAWDRLYRDLEKDLKRWTRRIGNGSDPLTPGEQAQLRSLITTVQALAPMSDEAAQIAAGSALRATQASAQSLNTALTALPAHVVATVDEVAAAFGWQNLGNPTAVASVVNGSIGQMTADWTNLSLDMQNRIANTVAQSTALGESPRKAARKLAAELGEDFGFGQARSLTISRTTMAAAYDQASATAYQQAHAEGILFGWEWLANPGACPVCSALGGQIFPAEQPPYRHPNCRCSTAPILYDDPRVSKGYSDGGPDLELKTGSAGWTTWTQKP